MPPGTTTLAPFPLYLLPGIPFRRHRRQSSLSTSTATTSPATSPSSSPPAPPSYLSHTAASYLQCHKCLTDLIPTSSIISKGFTGRHGRAYLVSPPPITPSTRDLPPGDLPNVHTHKAVPRQLVTGAHTVSDISCRVCGCVLGWKYVYAEEEAQRYKVGKYILETKRVVRGVDWEDRAIEAVGKGGTGSGTGADAETEFDSQNEEECEDLFAGIWSQGLALARRRLRDRERGFDEEE